MALTDYASLQTAVAAWLNRTNLTAQIPDFIRIAEARLNRELGNVRAMEIQTTLSTAAGSRTVPVPADMLEMKRLQVVGTVNTPLKYLAPDELAARYWQNDTGLPLAFCVTGGNIELAPIPDAVYALQLTYFQGLPALSDSNTSNWLLAQWPDAYLWGSLLAAQPFLMNDARLGMFTSLYAQAVKTINDVDWYSGSTMRVVAR